MKHDEKSETKEKMSAVFSKSEIEVMRALCPKGRDFDEVMAEQFCKVAAMTGPERIAFLQEGIYNSIKTEEDARLFKVSMDAMNAAKKLDEQEAEEAEEERKSTKKHHEYVAEEDEEFTPLERWNCPIAGHEADCVNEIKEIIAALSKFDFCKGRGFRTMSDWKGFGICSTQIEPTPANCEFRCKLDFAFQGWLLLHDHRLDGSGGNWSSGCFGSFWADIALTIPELRGRYLGIRVSFNPKPCVKRPGWFLLDIDEDAQFKMSSAQSSACHPNYGPCISWGKMLSDQSRYEIRVVTPEELAERQELAARKAAEEAARKAAKEAKEAAKAAKEAKFREENAERRRIDKENEDKRIAERVIRDEEQRKVREAEFAARVAAVAEREKENVAAMKAAKEEKARICEENAKLKKEAAEAARKAKYGPKK
nr:MAG: hypothetical protein [Lake Baikal virophage 4]